MVFLPPCDRRPQRIASRPGHTLLQILYRYDVRMPGGRKHEVSSGSAPEIQSHPGSRGSGFSDSVRTLTTFAEIHHPIDMAYREMRAMR
jgi:hypothetical protein